MMKKRLSAAATCITIFVSSALASAQLGGGCDSPSAGPDVIVGDLFGIQRWGTVGGITAYSIATDSCNVGDAVLPWIATTNEHPLIAQNLYRLNDGSIEQIGMSWLKHGFGALALNTCCTCNNPGTTAVLGVGCSDPYTTGLNGDQAGFGTFGGLGPRSEVDASTGAYPFPYGTMGQSGNAIYKRLQVHNVDLDPALNGSARYFAEGHYISPDDAAADNQDNNASYREVQVGAPNGGGWDLSLSGATARTSPAIQAWQDADPTVVLTEVDSPGDGLFIVGSHCTDNLDGTWHYEYAVYNMNSHRSGQRLTIPVPPGASVSGLGFHDVDYHSGEPFSGTDWSASVGAASVEWTCQPFGIDPNANALRFGTLYNFRFDVDVAPGTGNAELGLFRPGVPDFMTFEACVPELDCSTSTYCAAAPNSAGPGALISSSGTTSVAANDFTLVVNGTPPSVFGLFFYGSTQIQAPFGDGWRCAGGTVRRLQPPLMADGSGQVVRPVDFTLPPASSGNGAITPLSAWNFQLWYRDQSGPGGTGFNLSNGLNAQFCP